MALEALLKSVAASDLLDTNPSYSGWLKKKGLHRYCIIHGSNFFYYEDNKSKRPCGGFSLNGYRASEGRDESVIIRHGQSNTRVYIFEAGSSREQKEWIRKINAAVMANLIPLKSVSSEEPVYDEPEYDYTKLSPDDVRFVGAQEDGYVSIASEKMTGAFTGPVSAKGRPPRTQQRYSSKPGHTVQDDEQDIYSNIPDDTELVKRVIAPTPPPYDGDMDARYVFARQDMGGYITLKQPDEDKDGIYDDINSSRDDEQTFYEDMHADQAKHYEDMNAGLVYEDMTASPSQGEQYLCLTDNTSAPVYDAPTGHYVSPKPQTFANELEKKLSLTRRALPVPPLPPSRSGSLKSKEEIVDVNTLSDDELLPPSVYKRELSRDDCPSVFKNNEKIGTYLIRRARNGKDVLAVLDTTEVRHYIVFDKNGMHFLREDEPKFKYLADLIRYYYKQSLPTCKTKLSQPFR
ncbi:uncharacterized protein LOC130644483 [Hydractinia symbiolongicarpus]|uniref:uncharacterized protein LOC130644483 n=1 Tax=Hydractinia symbiolongicarpus TaxID=13093 RepID=UPI00254B4A51|nr:uncharacterized protein LOC130644483 [Hydractinia symbiolongicarpus]